MPEPGHTAPRFDFYGGIEVDGFCFLTDVTVYGGITVDPSPFANAAFINGSTVNGGLVVGEGSGFTTGYDLDTNGLTHSHSTINGDITLTNVGAFIVADTTIRGAVTMNGGFDWPSLCDGDPFCFGEGRICDSEVFGNVTVNSVNTDQAFIGDPREPFFSNSDCAGNTIHGSVTLKDSNFIRFDGEPSEIEGNSVTGSVRIDHSTAEVNENTIGGGLLCTNGSVIHPGAGPDVNGNTVKGANTCF